MPRLSLPAFRRLCLPALACLLIQLLCATPAWAWNRAGHMATGAIAYRELKLADPAALARIVAALRQHPQYAAKWEAQIAAANFADRDLMLFMLAARWADDIRGQPAFDHPVWHYINYPYQPPSIETAKPDKENVVDALEQNRLLARTATDPAQRAVALCWVMHLTGDVHQPLHTTQLINEQFPQGDRGGTAFFITAEPGGQPLSLHQIWDGLVIGSDRFQAVRNVATELVNRPDFQRTKMAKEMAETSPEKWAHLESFPLAVKYVYLEGKLVGGTDKGNAQPLPADYLVKAKAVAERQLTLAGYRMAASLRSLSQP